jgi:hypothetical protein
VKRCLLVLLVACEAAPAPSARALRVESRSQLIGGPKALGEIGDWLLENDQIRVIVHGIDRNGGHGRSNTPFGGSLIDADLVRPSGAGGRGNDQMGELLPSLNMEVLQPTSIRITADGSSGGAAVLTIDGTGADMLQMVATLSKGLLFSPELRFRQEYRLEPGARHVEIRTSVINPTTGDHPLPWLNPPELASLGIDIPGLDTLQLSVPFGHLLLFGAENQAFAPGIAGFNVRYAIIDTYATARGFPAFPGMVADYLATRGRGVSYGFMVPSGADNYPSSYRSLYEPQQQVTDHSVLMPYVYAAVTGVYTNDPPRLLGPGETYSFTSYFVVGRGDVASVVDVMHELRGAPTGTFAGRIVDERSGAAVAGAMVVVLDPAGRVVNQADTDANGAFRATLVPGDYLYRVVTDVRDTTASRPFRIERGRITSQLVQLPPPGRLVLQVFDELGRKVPCKVALVGRFAAANAGRDPRTFLYDLRLGERERPTAFDPNRTEFIENSWYLTDGTLNAEVRPGSYDLVVMRGVEYHVHREPVMVSPGAFVSSRVALRRAVATPGYVAADLHLHMANSTDSSMTLEERVASLAGEGLEYAAATDHNFITDYAPAIAKLSLESWLDATVGLELTTFEMGHFNAYPLRVDPGSVRGGDFKWAGEPPGSLFRQLRQLGKQAASTLVQVNHARDGVLGYFTQFNLDSETGEVAPRQGLRAVFAPFKPEFAPEQFSYDFEVLEVMNGKRMDLIHHFRGPDGQPVRDGSGLIAFPGQVDDWFTFLSRGKAYTAVGNSDSHAGAGQEPGYPRNLIWVGEGKDQPGQFGEADIMAGLRAHRVIMTNGPMIELTVDGEPVGALASCGAAAEVSLRVTSANFAPVEEVTVWANGEPAREYEVPAAEAHDFARSFSLPLARDTWIVVEASGSANLFPVMPPQEFEPLNVDAVIDALGAGLDLGGLSPSGELKPSRTSVGTPVAITNPIWCDADGNRRFDPPRPPIVEKPAPPLREADVRAAFHGIPEAP